MADIKESAVDFLDQHKIEFRWLLIDYFYEKRWDEDDEPYYTKRKHKLLSQNYVPLDVFHKLNCVATGRIFDVCYHTVADAIELKAEDDAWRIVMNVRPTKKIEDDPDWEGASESEKQWFDPQLEAKIIQADGDFASFNSYVMILKAAIANDLLDPNSQFPGYVLCTTKEWTSHNNENRKR